MSRCTARITPFHGPGCKLDYELSQHRHGVGRSYLARLDPVLHLTQLSLFPEDHRRQRRTDLETAMDRIRDRYGYESIRRGIMLTDPTLDLDAKGSNTIHPIGFLSTLN